MYFNTALRYFQILALFCFASFVQSLVAEQPLVTEHSALPPIEVNVFEPIEFKIEKGLKEGWATTDEVVEIDNEFTLPEKLQLREVPETGATFAWAPPGQYLIRSKQIYVNFTRKDSYRRIYEIRIIVKGSVPDVEPDPDDEPEPTPGENPFAGTNGLKVLIIEEQDQRSDLPAPQRAILSDATVRAYLDTHCAKNSNGHPEWSLLDQNTQFAPNASSSALQYKKALSLQRTSPFWVVISNGKQWASVPLPKDVPEMMALLRKYTPAS